MNHFQPLIFGLIFSAALLAFPSLQLLRSVSAQVADEKTIAPQIEHNAEKRITKIFVPAVDGKVKWADVSKSLLQYAEVDLGGIEIPDWSDSSRSIDLSSVLARISLKATDIALGDGIDFEIDEANNRLVIEIYHDFVGGRVRAAKARLRDLVLGSDESWKRNYGLTYDEQSVDVAADKEKEKTQIREKGSNDDAEKARLEDEPTEKEVGDLASRQGKFVAKRLCILIHGLNSRSSVMKPLAEKIKNEGIAVAYFDYPNDDRIGRSAYLFSKELRKHQIRFPKQKISIVAHSMGGLVARRVIEDPRLHSDNVDQLVMICTPNQGSNLAKVAIGMDVWEHFTSRKEILPDLSRVKASFADGVNDAATDLRPGSKFLADLNKLPRNKRVRYSLFIGNDGAVKKDKLELLAKKIEKWSLDSEWVKIVTTNGIKKIEDFEEVIEGKGDGVVAVKSAVLEGVKDVETFAMGHRSMWSAPEAESSKELFRSVIQRLK